MASKKGFGIGKVISLPPNAQMVIIKSTDSIHSKGDIVTYKAKFTPVIGKKYNFEDTRAKNIVILLGSGGRGTIISSPPPGKIRVTSPSDHHKVGDEPTYVAFIPPVRGKNYSFVENPDGTVRV